MKRRRRKKITIPQNITNYIGYFHLICANDLKLSRTKILKSMTLFYLQKKSVDSYSGPNGYISSYNICILQSIRKNQRPMQSTKKI